MSSCEDSKAKPNCNISIHNKRLKYKHQSNESEMKEQTQTLL